jgi:negative regulator of flagellin synthesis FlgM
MKIAHLNSVSNAFKAYNKTAKKPEAVAKPGQSADKVEISSQARDIQVAMKALSEIPESRSEKVEAIKAQISQGTYKPSADAIVDKLFSGISDRKL